MQKKADKKQKISAQVSLRGLRKLTKVDTFWLYCACNGNLLCIINVIQMRFLRL